MLGLFAACSKPAETTDQAAQDSVAVAPAPLATLEQAWVTDTVFRTPEAVLYDATTDFAYVANINGVNANKKDGDGFISRLKLDGTVSDLQWVKGLNDPKGMGIFGGKLYVSDITEVVVIDLATGKVDRKIAAENAKFLNDVAVDANGKVYITDSSNNRVYTLENGKISQLMETPDLDKPNGLFADGADMLIVSMNKGELYTLNPDQTLTMKATGLPGADGIAKTEKADYLVSNWNGEVSYVTAAGQVEKILDTKEAKINAADIDYAPAAQLLLVPTFFDNRVFAYRLK